MTSLDDTDLNDTEKSGKTDKGAADEGATDRAGADAGDPHTPAAGDADDPLAAQDDDEPPPPRLTPRQARRVRALTSAGVMVAVGVAMVVQFRREPSLLTFALYGGALILSGTAIMLSRAGRTRVAMAVLVAGFAFVVADQLLR